MTVISTLDLSQEILNKLKDKKVESLNQVETKVFNAINNRTSVSIPSSVASVAFIAPFIKSLESVKKLKLTRLARLIVLCDSSELCIKIGEEIKSLITKELVIILCQELVKLKSNKKSFEGAVDIVIGTPKRLNELILSETLKTKAIKNIIVLNFDKLDVDLVEKFVLSLPKVSVDSEKSIQYVVTSSDLGEKVKSFIGKHTNDNFENIEVESEDEKSTSENESVSSDDDVKKNVLNLSNNSEKDEDKESETEVNDTKLEEMDEDLLNKIRSAEDFIKFHSMSKLIIQEFSDIEGLSRLISLLSSKRHTKDIKPVGVKPKTFESGSKLSGREGYTAYHFVADKEINSKGYLFKSLKRLIDEEAVEKIERVQHTKDLMGFVFDLPSELDETFQGSWRDGKYDVMSLLEEVPELSTEDRSVSTRGRSFERGGFRGGRGNDRGGFRGGRGNDRGGRGGRGRGNDRGGYKRHGSIEGGSSAKLQKFD